MCRRVYHDHLKSGILKLGFLMVQFSDGPNHLKTGPFKIWIFQSGFQMIFDKWLGFRNSDPIQNPDHLQSNLFGPFKIQTRLDFRSPLYILIQLLKQEELAFWHTLLKTENIKNCIWKFPQKQDQLFLTQGCQFLLDSFYDKSKSDTNEIVWYLDNNLNPDHSLTGQVWTILIQNMSGIRIFI